MMASQSQQSSGAEDRARAVVDAAIARMEAREPYSDDDRARLERNFPWPSPESIRSAAASLAHARDKRVVNDLGNALDVGVPKEPADVILSDEDTAIIVVQALRGQHVRWTPEPAAMTGGQPS